MKYAILLCVSLTLLGCAAPQTSSEHAGPDFQSVSNDLAQVEDALARVENRLGHLESEFAAASADNEFTELAIDSVQWAEQDGLGGRLSDGNPTLLCHPSEWRGFGKLLRFIRLADPVLYLEADGRPTIQAHIETGGICNEEGSTRFALLSVSSSLEPGIAYHLRPRNGSGHYRWSVASDLVVAAK